MKRLINRAAALLLAALLLVSLTAPEAWAAGEEITISSAEEFLSFSQNCSLDAWSQGKTVRLTADIDLSDRDFAPIPTFGGTFLGGGHTISGLHVSVSGSHMGLFRYLQAGAVVQDLHVSGSVVPGGSRSAVGGIAGSNAGAIRNCSFRGTVKGDDAVGGIAGQNEESGEIAGCSVSGTILGQSGSGGVAGRNLGLLLKCTNAASVNTNNPDTSTSLEDLTADSALGTLTSPSNEESGPGSLLDSCADTGGVVGYSSGVVQSCTNTGTVGYPHVGYNVGGIAGRQTGYLATCVNSGDIYGRKDVGGIVGQAEPYIALNPDSDTLSRLRRELDTLDTLVNRALDHSDANADEISARLTNISTCAGDARDSSKILLDHTADFIDGNIDSMNSLSASITRALDGLEPALDDLSDAAGWMESLSDRLSEALDALGDATALGDDVIRSAQAAAADLRLAGEAMQRAVQALNDAAKALQQAVIIKDADAVNGALTDLSDAVGALGDAMVRAGEALNTLRGAIDGSIGDDEIAAATADLSDALTDMGSALNAASGALAVISQNVELDWDKMQEALTALQAALQDLQTAAGHLTDATADLQEALKNAAALSGPLQEALKKFSDTASLSASLSRKLQSAFTAMRDVVTGLREDGPINFTPLGQEVRDAGDDLFGSLADMSDELSALQDAVSRAGDTLSADLRAVSRQMRTVFDVVLDALEEVQGGDETDRRELLEDTSDEDIAATREGKVAECRNTGSVDGDRNVGGIVGSMSIEYDLDPEDDLSRFSLGSTYETKAVLQGCVNRGAVTAKKDCAGGVAGHMGLGSALDCQNYGDVTSTDGSYVGGIAGQAEATVRSSYAKCVLSGTNYVGGIAGWADRMRNCYAIASIAEGTEWVGAIAGDADREDGALQGNLFVDTGYAGIDGVSYAGIAEPVDFETLRQLSGVPTEFVSFTLTLTAGGETVAQIPFYYGEDLSLVKLPEVPEQEGSYGAWPAFDTSGLNSDITLEAVYTPWLTLVASAERDDKLALALAEGQFTEAAALHVTDSTQAPPASAEEGADVWDVSLTGAGLTSSDAVPLRLLNRTGGKAAVWQLVDGQWEAVKADVNGHYLLLTMTGASGTFCVCPAQGNPLPLLLALAAALLLAVLAIRRARKKRSAKKAAAAGSAAS